MKIRPATQSDLPAINEIYNQAVRKKYCTADLDEISMAERQQWFHLHNPKRYPVFVAEENDAVIGWLCYSAYRPGRRALKSSAEVSYYLHQDHLRKGIGSRLMEFALANASHYHFKNLFAILLERNTASIRLLEKFGFERWATLPNIAEIYGEKCSHVYYGRET